MKLIHKWQQALFLQNFTEKDGETVSENYIEAENDYMLGMKYKDIAAKYGVTINTVKSWKSRYHWNRKSGEKSMHTKKEKECTQKKPVAPVQPVMRETEPVNGNLTDNQRLFCLYYVKYRNKVKAYQKAYQCSYENACRNASTLGKNKEIQTEIDKIMNEVQSNLKISIRDLIQQQIDIARADINDYVDISNGIVGIRNDIDGTIVKEIKNTKDGISIKLYDKQKAIDFLKNNISDESGRENNGNTATLAEILLGSVQNRKLEDFEQEDGV